jgi:hypothetical protein
MMAYCTSAVTGGFSKIRTGRRTWNLKIYIKNYFYSALSEIFKLKFILSAIFLAV